MACDIYDVGYTPMYILYFHGVAVGKVSSMDVAVNDRLHFVSTSLKRLTRRPKTGVIL